jgi:D-tyrosyl-tRNA(Tyr) deacylase
VTVGGETVGQIGPGLVALVGVKQTDRPEDAAYIADKLVELRIFDDAAGRMNLSALETGASVLLVSQFTLFGDARKGRRPSYARAAGPELAGEMYEECVRLVAARGVSTATGRFGAEMIVSLEGDGPVTLLLDSERCF